MSDIQAMRAAEWADADKAPARVFDTSGATPMYRPSRPGEGVGEGEPVIVRLADVKPEAVTWLWPGRIAVGKLTLLAGDPGLGKSLLTLDMAATVSRGGAWPDAPGVATTPGGVVLLSAEDGLSDTVRPRLDAAGADMLRVVALKAIRSVGSNGKEAERTFDLSRDLAALEETILSMEGCKAVFIDPITAYLGGVDSHKNGEIRGLLAPFAALAEKLRVAVIAATHLNKSGSGPAIYRAMGSLAFAAAARAAWGVVKDKDDPRRRLLLPIKNNLAPDTGGLAYRIVPWPADPEVGRVEWESGPVSMTADDAMAGDRGDGDRTKQDDAVDWLRKRLAGGVDVPSVTVFADGKAAGISPRTLNRAKGELEIKPRQLGFHGGWVWSLPSPQAANTPTECQPPGEAKCGKPGDLCGEGIDVFDAMRGEGQVQIP